MYFRDRTSAKDWWKGATPLHEGQDLLGALDAVVVDLCAFPPGDSEYTHYSNVIMSTTVSQITSLTIIYSTVYSAADERKHQNSASLAFVRGPVNSPHKGTVTRKMLPFDDVIVDIDVVLHSKCRKVWRDLDGHFRLCHWSLKLPRNYWMPAKQNKKTCQTFSQHCTRWWSSAVWCYDIGRHQIRVPYAYVTDT